MRLCMAFVKFYNALNDTGQEERKGTIHEIKNRAGGGIV